MGKSPLSTCKFQELTKLISIYTPKPKKSQPIIPLNPKDVSFDGKNHVPLSIVVSDCVKRWFKDTLKEAKSGDTSMQILVAQMYFHGYGVAKDASKGRSWIARASKTYASAWKVCRKRPGYFVSDSDSDEGKVQPYKSR
ncbi:uncharacterized protein LOC126660251 [Mercurialis annua]|uniref:uncharacterized protein LOC126660251 n=1 Tax=Mercurialis annua TaxID=3986 RepID=UPI00215E1A13|nr:uncharacterized protein LOC126660251 [Mercurialis annua]XP_050209587.1 uncharacterized protein LOC126660251 [Mercurialis annua]